MNVLITVMACSKKRKLGSINFHMVYPIGFLFRSKLSLCNEGVNITLVIYQAERKISKYLPLKNLMSALESLAAFTKLGCGLGLNAA